MKNLQYKRYITVFIAGICSFASMASVPKLFIFRNDGGFNATHLKNGVSITHSTTDTNTMMQFTDEDGNIHDIPISAIDSCVVRQTDIPTLHLTLPDYPDRTDLWDKETYINCTLDIEGNGYCEDMSDLELQVRGRGNSTWTKPKKPMRLKFPKKISLFGLAKQKNYVLLANYIDDSLLKNAVAYWIAQRIGMPYANHTVPVDVTINGTHRGSYLLTEKVGINSGSVDIDEAKGILFELSTEFDEPYKFRSYLYDLPVMVKDPDFDELAEDNPDGPTAAERLKLWKDDFNSAERLAASSKAAQAFDIESFVRGVLLLNLAANNEIGYPKSFYIHKEALGSDALYKMGPAWDFDVAFNFLSANSDGTPKNTPPDRKLWINPLLDDIVKCPEFMPLYKEKLQNFASDDLPDLLRFIKDYAAQIEPSAKIDSQIWPETTIGQWYLRRPATDVQARAEELCKWLTRRMEFLLENASNSQL